MDINNFKCKPTYLDFPILQIAYILLWIPIGFIVSCFLSIVTINIVTHIMIFCLDKLFPMSLEMYMFAGGFRGSIEPFYIIVMIVYDLLLLAIGLELISKFLYKKRIEFEGDNNE